MPITQKSCSWCVVVLHSRPVYADQSRPVYAEEEKLLKAANIEPLKLRERTSL